MWKYPSDLRVSENCIDGRKTGPRQLALFPDTGNVRIKISRICLKEQKMTALIWAI